MILLFAAVAFFMAFETCNVSDVSSHEISGYVAVESKGFFNDALFFGQKRNNASIALQSEYYHEWQNGSIFTFVPFGRLDSSDPERSHFDIRELNYLWLKNNYELRFGIGKVFWGATEFVHLVDIINQTDLVEAIDQEEKLGQPMIQLTIINNFGLMDIFVLPWFRERTFPGVKGRLRPALKVNTNKPRYEDANKEHHVDIACRYSNTIGNMDLGGYHFIGTGREPTLLLELDSGGKPTLIPLYEQINQTGLDLQLVAGSWLWKLEAIYRSGQGQVFFSSVGGFEYTLVGVADSDIDLGLIGEYAYDDRGSKTTTPFDNDMMLGLRIASNDVAGTEFLAGFTHDTDTSANILALEASRRIGKGWKALFEAYVFSNQPTADMLFGLRNDDYLSLTIFYYF